MTHSTSYVHVSSTQITAPIPWSLHQRDWVAAQKSWAAGLPSKQFAGANGKVDDIEPPIKAIRTRKRRCCGVVLVNLYFLFFAIRMSDAAITKCVCTQSEYHCPYFRVGVEDWKLTLSYSIIYRVR